MWREGVFVETFCLSFWMKPLGSFQNYSWHQSEVDFSWPYTKNTSGDYVHHFLFLSTPNYHDQPDYGLHRPRFWLDPISWSLGQVAEHTFSMVVKTSEMKALELLLRCYHSPCSIHLVFLVILYGHKKILYFYFLWLVQRRDSIWQHRQKFGHEE